MTWNKKFVRSRNITGVGAKPVGNMHFYFSYIADKKTPNQQTKPTCSQNLSVPCYLIKLSLSFPCCSLEGDFPNIRVKNYWLALMILWQTKPLLNSATVTLLLSTETSLICYSSCMFNTCISQIHKRFLISPLKNTSVHLPHLSTLEKPEFSVSQTDSGFLCVKSLQAINTN